VTALQVEDRQDTITMPVTVAMALVVVDTTRGHELVVGCVW
jgi:hypothetical protein